eukprot:TRINITY_DN1916_c0_g1_i1.p3 TRINITY_DN1916_c0_g1~~TRINITY_DN1916_c0_g1_i1.p3  ORF type:complete len:130 (+),score=26.98 TRINITY_DN1916_c0_g1_i1:43-432(+)
MAAADDSGLTIPQLITYALSALFALRVLGYLHALFLNSNVGVVLASVPAAFCIACTCLWGQVTATQVLLIALGIVTLHGCGEMCLALNRLKLAFQGVRVQMPGSAQPQPAGPPRPQPQPQPRGAVRGRR